MRWIYRAEEIFCVILMVSAVTVLITSVLLRNFGYGITWSDEFVRYSFVWITFIGGAICARKGGHISVDLILSIVNDKGKRMIVIISSVIILIFLVLMIIFGINVVRINYIHGQVTPVLSIPMYINYLAFPIGFFLMLVHYIELSINILYKNMDMDHSID